MISSLADSSGSLQSFSQQGFVGSRWRISTPRSHLSFQFCRDLAGLALILCTLKPWLNDFWSQALESLKSERGTFPWRAGASCITLATATTWPAPASPRSKRPAWGISSFLFSQRQKTGLAKLSSVFQDRGIKRKKEKQLYGMHIFSRLTASRSFTVASNPIIHLISLGRWLYI